MAICSLEKSVAVVLYQLVEREREREKEREKEKKRDRERIRGRVREKLIMKNRRHTFWE